jgi:triosephosphate isomerase
MNEASVGKTVMQVVLWFFVPLLLLTFADRTWAWSQYVKRKARVLERWNMRKNEQANS